ncbi:MAG: hypothetical protein JSV44_10525 [Candidatus Zixiibacteriota bacterium]|nr:MAG: hypothetical protein JSV44_10525 [candidate division Zixibacteria bacterium]
MKTMKLFVALVALPALMFSVSHAKGAIGLVSGNLTTADACGFGVGYIGGFAGIADEGTSIFGGLTYGFSDYTEGRVKIGFFDPDVRGADPKIMVALDFKYEFMDYYDRLRKNPFDLAFGGFMEFVDFEYGSVLGLGGSIIGSIPYRFQSGHRLIPYARLNLRLERVSYDAADFDDESDFRVGLNLGTKYEVSDNLGLYGEFQLDGNAGLFLGLDFRAF